MRNARSETTLVTPAMAETWLSQANYERQRRRTEWQVTRLAMEMEAGRFIAGSQIHFGVLDGKLHLLNGQHTLGGIVKSATAVLLSILYTDVDNEKELGELYGRHDRHRGRTPHDAFLGMGLAAELGLEDVEINSLAPALKWVAFSFRRPSVTLNPQVQSTDWLAEQMREWSPVATTYFDFVRDARHGMKAAFRRAPVLAIGLAATKHQAAKAAEFWRGAVDDEGLTKYDPRRALNQYLAQNRSGYGSALVYMRNVAATWNKFFDGEEVMFLRPGDTGKLGVTIKGTPYKAFKPQAKGAATEDEATVETYYRQTVSGEARV